MTEIDDATIEKIANAVRNKRISDRWQDPKKAEFWGGLGWFVAAFLGLGIFLTIAGATMFNNYEDDLQEGNDIYQKISIANMDCEALKKTLVDLEASESDYVPDYSVEKQIIARCK